MNFYRKVKYDKVSNSLIVVSAQFYAEFINSYICHLHIIRVSAFSKTIVLLDVLLIITEAYGYGKEKKNLNMEYVGQFYGL